MGHLKVIPYYTGIEKIEDALRDERSIKLLWLEILFNDEFDWEEKLNNPIINNAYMKSSAWFKIYKTSIIRRGLRKKPLRYLQEHITPDPKDLRKFIEVLYFEELRVR